MRGSAESLRQFIRRIDFNGFYALDRHLMRKRSSMSPLAFRGAAAGAEGGTGPA